MTRTTAPDGAERDWRALAALLPPHLAGQVLDCWSIGEQEAGLGLLVSGLDDESVPISEETRALLSATAEDWGVREALEAGIAGCRPLPGDASPVRLLRAPETAPLPAGAVAGRPDLSALVLVPWITRTPPSCGRLLARAHSREPWGGLSYIAEAYVVLAPEGHGRTLVLDPADAQEAQDALAALIPCEECAGFR
ncbi:hypothetical protein [Streptomyces sp. NPDC088789]|uniref:hypothetical protein n=1 Tax=Streptomyces sp. NPDC088789 TaxID=3365899 RepID=UPI003807A0BD